MDQARIIQDFHQGQCIDAWQLFGAHFTFEGAEGVRFTVYAPHARNVSVIGSFNEWDDTKCRMSRTGFSGVWSVFVPGVREWESYKYRIEDTSGKKIDKSDPYAFYSETRPENASKVYNLHNIRWDDEEWMRTRSAGLDQAVSVYEVYAGGWKHNGEYPYTYGMLQENLIPYVKEHGFTHIELMPLNEYPFDGSWGYQASGYYSVTSRYGNPTEFARFVNACHQAGIGVIMDMVPVHFVKDAFGLRKFDGQALYEYRKPEDAESQWGTLNFDLWNEEVRSFLISSAMFWCRIYHIDGIRMDAVANMIYWAGNRDRGTNEGALNFMKRLNYYLKREYPQVMLIAEDSSDFPKVTASTLDGGLGFDYKWDLGWMNDTLKYFATDPIYRVYDHHKLTFSMAYFYSERFILPLSHDENVHGKKTVIDRMWGSYEQKFSQVKTLYAYMFAHPGKKLNFMGNEFATFREFDEKKELDWFLLTYPVHDAFLRFFTDLNRIYTNHPCLFRNDYDFGGFQWIDADNAKQSVFSFYREDDREYLLCIMNLTPAQFDVYDVPVPQKGTWTEILNTEKDIYGGNNFCNYEPLRTKTVKGEARFPQKITLRLAPLGAVWFTCPKKKTKKTVKEGTV
ncbi:MAG: 1,4-alpha-glucan branching protein GlgB [Solobacterium sp.]|nr:1,4-alpha-glucan branching protein GlgB [Solobacterium sp.]